MWSEIPLALPELVVFRKGPESRAKEACRCFLLRPPETHVRPDADFPSTPLVLLD